MTTQASVDLIRARQTVAGDAELFAELVQIFTDQVPQISTDLRSAMAARDSATIGLIAHRLKGSLAVVGACCAATAAQVEKSAKTGFSAALLELAYQLDAEVVALIPALQSVVAGGEI